MSIINSSTTGHSRPQERRFSNKLFIGLAIAVVAAFAVVMLVFQKKTVSTDPVPQGISDSNTTSAPVPVQDQPKD